MGNKDSRPTCKICGLNFTRSTVCNTCSGCVRKVERKYPSWRFSMGQDRYDCPRCGKKKLLENPYHLCEQCPGWYDCPGCGKNRKRRRPEQLCKQCRPPVGLSDPSTISKKPSVDADCDSRPSYTIATALHGNDVYSSSGSTTTYTTTSYATSYATSGQTSNSSGTSSYVPPVHGSMSRPYASSVPRRHGPKDYQHRLQQLKENSVYGKDDHDRRMYW